METNIQSQSYNFHIYNDIEILRGKYPLCFLIDADVFVMQENRVVFIGNEFTCENWIKINKNKFCEQLPLFKKGVRNGM